MFLGEFIKELFPGRRTRGRGVNPQMHRGMKYAAMRAASNVLLRDINTSLIIYEMYRGANVIYADFTDYDEIAHHSGPERVEALQALDGIDDAIATLVKAAEDAPRPYKFIVLSDHGQSLGATFKQRYGQSLGEVVRDLMGGRATVVADRDRRPKGRPSSTRCCPKSRAARASARPWRERRWPSKTTDGVVDLDADDVPPPADASTIAVVGSGNLGLVYFTGNDHRLTVEELEALHPGLVATLAAHPGVGAADGPLGRARRDDLRADAAPAPSTEERPRGRGPDDDLRPAHAQEPAARGRHGARPGPPAPEPSTTR